MDASSAPLPPEPAITDLPRESAIETALGGGSRAKQFGGSSFGGYGELTLNAPVGRPGVIDLRRVVFFFGHDFTDQLRFYSEVEFEHAVSSSADKGEAEIEQAFLDWLPGPKINLRGGLILMPMGIVNVYHEPPSFFAVDRPDVDTVVIPTTWREPGVGIFGELTEGLRYQAYVVNGFDANGFSAQSGIRDGHQEAQLAFSGDLGAIARLDYEPWLGTDFGVSAYGGTSGNTLTPQAGRVPVGLFDVDARSRIGGLTLRFELAALVIGDALALNQALQAAGLAAQLPVARLGYGGYAEAGYDTLRWLAPSSSQALVAFVRLDAVDTQAVLPPGYEANPLFRRYSAIVGLCYKPIAQIALKGDYRRQQFSDGSGYDQLDAAITWLF